VIVIGKNLRDASKTATHDNHYYNSWQCSVHSGDGLNFFSRRFKLSFWWKSKNK
jgi:hypothetical protein